MLEVWVRVHDGEVASRVTTVAELQRVIDDAREEAKALGKLNIILLEAANGNALSLVVGGDKTVLTFTYSHLDPPYYASRGAATDALPFMTCYVGLAHHTEFPQQYVISFADGLVAAHEFAESAALPGSVEWVET